MFEQLQIGEKIHDAPRQPLLIIPKIMLTAPIILQIMLKYLHIIIL